MKRVILLKTQLEEASKFAISERFEHKRIGVILLDNFIEIQLSKLIQQKFTFDGMFGEIKKYSTSQKNKILSQYDELLKASVNELIITSQEKSLLLFCHKLRNNLYHKIDEENLLVKVAIIIFHTIIKKYQAKWKTARMFTAFNVETIDPYHSNDEQKILMGKNSTEDWREFMEKYFICYDENSKTASELFSIYLLEKLEQIREYEEFVYNEFIIFFPYAENWKFNDYLINYSFKTTQSLFIQKIREIEDIDIMKNEMEKLKESYKKKWRYKKGGRLKDLKESIIHLAELPIEQSLEKLLNFRDEILMIHESFREASNDLEEQIQNEIDQSQGN